MELYAFIRAFHFRNEVWVLTIPLAMMAIDFITGTTCAWSKCTFKSSKMRRGLTKKVGEIAILVIGELFSYGLSLPDVIMNGLSAYIIFMELMSVFENLKKMGVRIPGFIAKVLNTVDATLREEDITKTVEKIAELEKEIALLKGGLDESERN